MGGTDGAARRGAGQWWPAEPAGDGWSSLLLRLPVLSYRCPEDRRWALQSAHGGCLQLTGFTAEELVGPHRHSFAELVHPDDRSRVWIEIQDAVAEARPFRVEYRLLTANGRVKHVVDQGYAVLDDESGAVLALEGLVTEVSPAPPPRPDTSAPLGEQTVALATALMAPLASHALEGLRRATQANGSGVSLSVRSALAITEEVVERLELLSSVASSAPEAIDLDAFIEENQATLEVPGFSCSSVELQLERLRTRVLAEPQLLRRWLKLLVTLVASTPGGAAPVLLSTRHVTTLEQSPRENATGWVRIAAAALSPLALAGAETPLTGLSPMVNLDRFVLEQSVTALGGALRRELGVNNEPQLCLYLPAEPTSVGDTLPSVAPPRTSLVRPKTAAARATVLVVDDTPMVLKTTSAILRRAGYDVLVAESGKQALEIAFETTRIDLLVTDVSVRDLDGREIADRLATKQPDLRVLFMSGYPADQLFDDRPLASSTRFLQKPFTQLQLAKYVQELLPKD